MIVECLRIWERAGVGELEDLAFKYLEPTAYQELEQTVAGRKDVAEQFLDEVQEAIRKSLAENAVPAEVEGRIKRLYSIHQKARRQKRTLDQVYDLLAVRIITDSVKNCYAALGVIHNEWHPIPGRIKDFIAIPRPQSDFASSAYNGLTNFRRP